MDPDNVTKSAAVEDDGNIKSGKEPQDGKLTEKDEDQKVVVPLEEMKTKDSEPIVTEQTTPETITTEVSERKEEIADAVAEIIKKKQDEASVTDDEKEENDPTVSEKQPVPADEIAIIKKEESKDESVNEPLKIEEPVNDVKKDDEAAENGKENKSVEAVETKENGVTNETANETKDGEKLAAVENVKTESKEEQKVVDERKVTDSTTKEEEKTSPKTSISLMGKVKKSFMKAKKAITGKNASNTSTSTSTSTNTKTSETKEVDKA